jgi:cell division protein FtsW (lipid II flippase)
LNEGFYTYQTQMLVRHAGWFGHGFGHSHFILYYAHGIFAFAELISMFGWATGIVFAAGILWLFARVLRLSKNIKYSYGNILLRGLFSLLAQLIYPMLMGLGTSLVLGINMPIIGGGAEESQAFAEVIIPYISA